MLFYSGVAKETRAKEGVGILIHTKYANEIVECKYINSRIIVVRIKFKNETFSFIGIYAPENCRQEFIRSAFFNQLQQAMDEIPKTDSVIILGDFNSRIGNDPIPGVKQKFNEPEQNENGELLINLCTTNELRITNTYFMHNDNYKYTFSNSRGHQSMIDFIITNRKIHPRTILDTKCLTSANLGSDHNLLMTIIRINKIIPKQIPQKAGTPKINIENIHVESTRKLYQDRLETQINNKQLTDSEDVEERWQTLKTCIINAAKEAFGERTTKKRNTIKRKTPWFCEEIKNKCREKRQAYLRYRSDRTERSYRAYKRTRNETHELVRSKKQEFWNKFSKQLEHDIYGLQKEIWRFIRGQRKEINEIIEISHIQENQWIKYLKEMYADQTDVLSPTNPITTITEETIVITEQEVEETIKTLKNRKSAGHDEIPNELLKYGGKPLIHQLTKLINAVINTQYIPQDWKTSVLILLYKKGEKSDPRNYRGINLLCTVLKLTTKIIARRLEGDLYLEDEQQGFHKGRSCNDAIFIIRQVKEKSLEFNRPAFLCFVDLVKAFDKVKITDIVHLLYKRNISLRIIKTIENIYANNSMKAKIHGQLSETIPTGTGIRQGDSLSPLLFNIIMDEIVKKVKTKRGYPMGDNTISVVCYADDAILLARSEDDLQRILHEFNTTAKMFNMQISSEKTKCMTISINPIRCKLEIDGKIIEQVNKFNYLGTLLTSNGTTEEELKSQVDKACRIAGCLNDMIWRNNNLQIATKSRIYKAVIRPILTYTCETRPETTQTARMCNTAEMKILRRIKNKTLRDRIRNTDIRKACHIENINEWTSHRKNEWNEHITRMAETRTVLFSATGCAWFASELMYVGSCS